MSKYKKEDLRPVEVIGEGENSLNGWLLDFINYEDYNGIYVTCAVVELEGGNIERYNVSDVKFTDRKA